MPRSTMYTLGSLLLLGILVSISIPAQATEKQTYPKTLQLIPDVLDSQSIYQSRHVIVSPDVWHVAQWQTVEIPADWGDDQLYIELWDHANRPVPMFKAHRFTSRMLDISSIDPTNYPSLRVILFQAKSEVLWPATELRITYTQSFNTRLVVLLTVALTMLVALIVASIFYRIAPAEIWRSTRDTLHALSLSPAPRQAVILIWQVVVWSAIFALPLGSFAGGIQIVYLLIKLPFLFICSFLISACANVVIAKLIGNQASLSGLIVNALHVLATTAITLAAMSPILWWLVIVKEPHDAALLWALAMFAVAYCLGSWRLYLQFKAGGSRSPLISVFIWTGIYAVVLLQLGWLLRPWIGVLDPIFNTVPFSRLYAGNVFEEISLTINRLL